MASFANEDSVHIVLYEDRFCPDFKLLNMAWLQEFELLEPPDLKQLDAPRQVIIEPGGQIFLALEEEKVVGTCAILRIEKTVFELAKLAVAPTARHRGIARRLTSAAIEWGCFGCS